MTDSANTPLAQGEDQAPAGLDDLLASVISGEDEQPKKRGRQMPEGPPLLKERRYLRKDVAEQLWKSLQTQGWKKARPLWGATAEL